MALPSWPSDVPSPFGIQGTLGSDQLWSPPRETRMDDGPIRARRTRLYRETPRTIQMWFTRPQLVSFMTFVQGVLNDGTSRFTAKVLLPNGSFGVRTCRFSGKISEQDRSEAGAGHSMVSFTLVVKDWGP